VARVSRGWLGSFSNAAAGVRLAVRTQRNVRLHLVFALAALGLGFHLRLGRAELALVALAIGLVLGAELLNSALEALVDLVTAHEHPLAKAAKDMAAGAVLVTAAAALAVGWLVFLPHVRARVFP
jgi:diacylglycerol kinase